MAAAVRLRTHGASIGIFSLAGHNSCMVERSTAILKLARKSASMMGKANGPPTGRPPADICTRLRPQAFMVAPEAGVRAGLIGWAVLEKGRME